VTDADVQRVQAEARELVRSQALARAQRVTLSARSVSDFARFNRVEGIAVGYGLTKQFGGSGGVSTSVRVRYGVDDKQTKGSVALTARRPNGSAFRLFATRDFRDVGDVTERSTVINSFAAQEFGSDYSDPYLARALGASAEVVSAGGIRSRFTGSYEWQSPLTVAARPISGVFEPPIPADNVHASRFAVEIDRPPTLSFLGTEFEMRAEARFRVPYEHQVGAASVENRTTIRGAVTANIERPFGDSRLVTATTIAAVAAREATVVPPQELVFLGGPATGPGYDYHVFASTRGFTEHVEWRLPAPFIPFSLGRFGRVPDRGTVAPFAHVISVTSYHATQCVVTESRELPARFGCEGIVGGLYPSIGVGYLTPFDLLRIDVARGLRSGRGRWTFSIDVSRDFWSVL
jgi:hypothetical protein